MAQGVLFWDGIALKMEQIINGHTQIRLLRQIIPVNKLPLYTSAN